jgi:hypothetical protein
VSEEHILVVEDEPDIAELIEYNLSSSSPAVPGGFLRAPRSFMPSEGTGTTSPRGRWMLTSGDCGRRWAGPRNTWKPSGASATDSGDEA